MLYEIKLPARFSALFSLLITSVTLNLSINGAASRGLIVYVPPSNAYFNAIECFWPVVEAVTFP